MIKFFMSLFLFSVFAYADTVNVQLTVPTGWTISGTTLIPPGGIPPGAPTGCVAAVNGASSLALSNIGGTFNLAVTCSSSSTSISWTKNGVGASTAQNWNDTLAANSGPTILTYTYQVTMCNGAACVTVPTSPLTVTVATSSVGPGPISCPGFTTTHVLNFTWLSPGRLTTPMGLNDAVVAVFTTGNLSNPTSNLANIGAVEYGSTPSARIATLSATPCDWSAQSAPGASASGITVSVPFAVANVGSAGGYFPNLAKNTTYYFNVKNNLNGGCAFSGVCNLAIQFAKSNWGE